MIILSIPFIDNNQATALKNRYSAKENFTELRLDYSKPPFNLENLVDENTILTIRDIDEGGINDFAIAEKSEFYNRMQYRYNCWVDSELFRYDQNIKQSDKLILSYHQNMSDKLDIQHILNIAHSYDFKILKLVLNISDIAEYLKICEKLKHCQKDIILIANGRLSKLSRLLYKHLGFYGTFIGCPENSTAKNQLDIVEARLLGLDTISDKTKIGGIIGGEQVNRSLGLNFYNKIFQERNIDAVYWPFYLKNESEINTLVNHPNLNFYGFSITMPLKKSIPALMDYNRISNLLIIDQKRFYNSDEIALKKSLEYLDYKPTSKLLIVGSGALAELSVIILSNKKNIFLTSRNIEAGKALSARNKIRYLQIDELQEYDFSLIINCTPIGMKGENLLQEFSIKRFKALLDLPYAKKATPVVEYCRENCLKYVDGKKFWKWQSNFQLDKFLDVLEG